MTGRDGAEGTMRRASGNWMRPQRFAWRRISAIKDRYELRAGDECLARLTLGGLLLPTARVEAGGDDFELAVGGMANRQVTIADAHTGQVVAGFERRWSGRGGVLRFQDGGQLEWRRKGWWRPAYEFTDRFSNPLVRFALDGTVEGYGTGAEWRRSIESRRDLLLVLALGWLLLLVGGEARLPAAPARPEPVRPPAVRPVGRVVLHRAREAVDIEAAG
jgi:hypothetical protein